MLSFDTFQRDTANVAAVLQFTVIHVKILLNASYDIECSGNPYNLWTPEPSHLLPGVSWQALFYAVHNRRLIGG